jgi:hypothetical protein
MGPSNEAMGRSNEAMRAGRMTCGRDRVACKGHFKTVSLDLAGMGPAAYFRRVMVKTSVPTCRPFW